MDQKLAPHERVRVLTRRIEALKTNTSIEMTTEERVSEIRRAEKALAAAYRDKAEQRRMDNKISHAGRTVETAEQKFAKAMHRAGK